MKNQHYLLFLIIIAGLISLGACRKRARTQQNPNAVSTTQEAPAGGAAMVGEKFFFRGMIANNLKIEMIIIRDRDQLTGAYFYPKVGKNIELKGTTDKDGNVNLRETDEAGQETGMFKGRWKPSTGPPDVGLSEIEGKWSKPDGSKETAFKVTQQPIEFTATVRVVPKLIREVKKDAHYSVDAEYPQIEGDARFDKFNREARNLISKNVAAFKTAETATESEPGVELPAETQDSTLDVGYEIRSATDDLISVEFTEGEYSRGAAHPNSTTAVLNYDVKNGKKLALADLFNPNSKYLAVMSVYCMKELKDRSKKDSNLMLSDEMIQTGAGPRADNYQAWAITKKGLWITFDPYQVAPYAAGPQYVLVPYSALKEIIKPDGPIASLAK